MSEDKSNTIWSRAFKAVQVVFFVGILICTVYNLRLTVKQTNLIFKPVVGVVDVKTTRILAKDKEDAYQNVEALKIDFILENTGSLPAKDFKITTIGKIGNTLLPRTESEEGEGVVLIQNTRATNTATVNKGVIARLVEKEEELIYTIQLSYSDWENYKNYDYSSRFQIYVVNKSPLQVGVKMLPER